MSQAKLDCPKIQNHLALYAGRDLEQPLCLEVEAHLLACESCRRELARAAVGRERIAVLGSETSRALAFESADLWPAMKLRLAEERASSRTAAALVPVAPLAARSFARRRGLPLSIAAAAALLLSLQFGSAPKEAQPQSFLPALGSPALAPIVPAESVATNKPVETAPAVGLRRALPGEERLRDSSAPLDGRLGSGLRLGAQDEPNSLAADTGLR